MQGLWQRRKVNLNATTQQTAPSSTSANANATLPPPPPPSTSTPSDEPPRPAAEPVPPAFGAVEGTPVPSSTSSQSKRKLRLTRSDEGHKCGRTATGTGNTTRRRNTRRRRCASQTWAAWTHAWRKCSSLWQCLLHTLRSTSIPACSLLVAYYYMDFLAVARLCLRTRSPIGGVRAIPDIAYGA